MFIVTVLVIVYSILLSFSICLAINHKPIHAFFARIFKAKEPTKQADVTVDYNAQIERVKIDIKRGLIQEKLGELIIRRLQMCRIGIKVVKGGKK